VPTIADVARRRRLDIHGIRALSGARRVARDRSCSARARGRPWSEP